MSLTVTFDRIGRDHHVSPLILSDLAEVTDANVNDICKAIFRYARPKLVSSNVEVEIADLDASPVTGRIFCGYQSGGAFRIEPTSAEVTP